MADNAKISVITTGDDMVGLLGLGQLFRIDGIPSLSTAAARVLASDLIDVCEHIEESWSRHVVIGR